jgi:ketosteroid isomerase-like protein
MSEGNVEIVRRGFAKFNRGDIEGAWRSGPRTRFGTGPSPEDSMQASFGDATKSGHSGNGSAAFEEIRVELVELIKVEDERLIAENVAYLRGRDGIEVQARSAWLITTRDGEQTSLTMYQTKQEALEAARPRD